MVESKQLRPMVRTQYYRTAFQASTGLCKALCVVMSGIVVQADNQGMAWQMRGLLCTGIWKSLIRCEEVVRACIWQSVCLAAVLCVVTWAFCL